MPSPFRIRGGVWSAVLRRAASDRVVLAAVFGLFEGIDGHASLQEGTWPADAPGDIVDAAVPVPDATALDLSVGDTVTMTDRLAGGEVTVRVVGTYAVDDVTSAYDVRRRGDRGAGCP